LNKYANISAADSLRPQSGRNGNDDSLASVLLYLAAHHGRALSYQALIAGLPIEGGQLTVGLFSRAAQHGGLEAMPVKRDLQDIPAMVLPAVLLMNDGSARVLTKIDVRSKQATLVNSSSQQGPQTFPFSAIEPDYLGYAFFIKPAVSMVTRDGTAEKPASPHWFWPVIRRFWGNYSHVAIAAFIINLLALASPLFVMNVYDRVIPNGAVPSLVALAIGLIIAITFDFALRLVRSQIVDVTGKKIDVVLAADIFEHVLAIKMAKRPTSVGILANQLRDFDSVRDFFTSGTVVSATDLVFALLFIGALFIVAGPLAWIPLLMLPAMMIIGAVLQKPLQNAMNKLQAESSARHGVLVEAMAGIEAVRARRGDQGALAYARARNSAQGRFA